MNLSHPSYEPSQRPRGGVLLFGLLLVPIHTIWLIRVETELGVFGFNMTDVSLFYTPVALLFLLSCWNLFVHRWYPKAVVRPTEMVLLYVLLTLSSAFAGSDLLQNLTPVLVHPFWFASPENGWASRFHALIPSWFAPRDPSVLVGYYTGSGFLSTWEILRAWGIPCLVWGSFLLVIAGMMLCLSILLRHQWAEHERISFPVIQLPLELISSKGDKPLIQQPLFLLGVFIPSFLESLNVFHSLNPTIPSVSLGLYNVGQLFPNRPWNALARWPPLWVSAFPFGIGLTYFLPLDLAFSSWFFYLFRRSLDVLGSALGWDQGFGRGSAQYPFIREQAAGAWVGVFLLTIWTGRRYFAEILKKALGRAVDAPSSLRWAVWGLVAGFLYLILFSWKAGMAVWVALLFFSLYFLLTITMTRIRVQLGPPALELFFVNPEYILVEWVGSAHIPARSLTVLSYYFWFNRCYRCQPMAHQMECLEMARLTGLQNRPLLWGIFLAIFLGVGVGLSATLRLYYEVGQTSAKIMTYRTGVGWEAFNRLDNWLRNPQGPDSLGIMVTLGATLLTLFLGSLSHRFTGFPFHPIGYAFATCYAMEYFWFLFFITWLIKALIIRYGGMKLYRQGRPLFLGLILGDCLMATFWGIIGWLFGWHGSSRYG